MTIPGLEPTPEALLVALEENWCHARHQETLRERQNAVYWVAWGAVLAFVASSGHSPFDPDLAPENRATFSLVFFVMGLFSAVTLGTTLKWSAEFANHVTAAFESASALHLIAPITDAGGESHGSKSGRTNPRKISAPSRGRFLPYPEFRGYMALPLDLPLIFNVAPAMLVLQVVGLFGSGVVFFMAFVEPQTAIGIALALCAAAVFTAWRVQRASKKAILQRTGRL
jgi:hypothetical protein